VADDRGLTPLVRRVALITLAFAGTAAYAASFLAAPEHLRPHWLPRLAVGVAIASALSWPALGVYLTIVSPDRATRQRWFGACLLTVAFGELWLRAAAGWNLLAGVIAPSSTVFFAAHAALLLGADTTMGVVFTRHGQRLGMARRLAIVVWVVGMNGVFAAQVFAFARPLGYWPW